MSDKPTCALTRAADIIEEGIAEDFRRLPKNRINGVKGWHWKHTRQLVKDLRVEAKERK